MNNHVLSGVHCTVCNCVHHCADNSCAAPSITVNDTSNDCSNADETLCSTFKKNG